MSSDDCTVQKLTVGGSDDSYIDLYQFEVSRSAKFEFAASSDTLDTVLLLATPDLEYLAVETGSSGRARLYCKIFQIRGRQQQNRI